MRYLGSKHGYYGTTPDDVYNIEWIIESYLDYHTIYHGVSLFAKEPLTAEQCEPFEKALGGWLAKIEKILEDKGSKFLVGDNITVADFLVFYTTSVKCDNPGNVKDEEYTKAARRAFEGLPNLVKWHEMMKEENKKYMDWRP